MIWLLERLLFWGLVLVLLGNNHLYLVWQQWAMNLYLQAALFVSAGGIVGAAYNAAIASYALVSVLSASVAPAPAVIADPTPTVVAVPLPESGHGPFIIPTLSPPPTPRPTIAIPDPAPDRRPEVSPFAPPSRPPSGS